MTRRSEYDRFTGSDDVDDEENDEDAIQTCYDQHGLRVRREKCETCIFRPGNLMQLRAGRVASMVADCRRLDGFVPCHELLGEPIGAVCRGAFDVLDTTPLQVARRLGYVVLVDAPGVEATTPIEVLP